MLELENIRAVIGQDIDIVTLDFRPDSPDYVPSNPIHAGIVPDMANAEVRKRLEVRGERLEVGGERLERPKTVGLFRDEMPQTVVTHAYNYHLDYILLMGSESDIYIDNLRRTLVPDILPDVRIVKQ